MFSKEQLVSLLQQAAENNGVATYYFSLNKKKVFLKDVLKEAAIMLENSTYLGDMEDTPKKINFDRCSCFLVDKPFTYLTRRFTQGDIIKVIGYRKSDGDLVIMINDGQPIAGGKLCDLTDIYNGDFISELK